MGCRNWAYFTLNLLPTKQYCLLAGNRTSLEINDKECMLAGANEGLCGNRHRNTGVKN